MSMFGHNQTRRSSLNPFGLWRALPLLVIVLGTPANFISAQATSQENLSQEIQKLTAAMARTQAQLEQSQRQLDEMRNQLTELQRQMAQSGANAVTQSPGPVSASSSSSQAKPEA